MAVQLNTISDTDMVISHWKLRRLIGILGGGLPYILLLNNWLVSKANILNNPLFVLIKCNASIYISNGVFKESISHYYYTPSGILFVGILVSISIFLFCYKGHKLKKGEFPLSDKLLTNVAGFGLLGIVSFPTANGDACLTDNFRIFVSTEQTGTFHYISAILFFTSISILSFLNFRRTKSIADFGKLKEHNVYKICGIGIASSIFTIGIYQFIILPYVLHSEVLAWNPVFWLESLALVFFAISWLKKGHVQNLKFNLFKTPTPYYETF